MPNYRKIEVVYRQAILDALKRWDKKTDLDKLVADSIIHSAISYFSEEKKVGSRSRATTTKITIN
ncbi:MAG: hypothetical protein AABW72_00970 [archaeon]